MDLDWLKASWLDGKDIAYWGDIDTWGLAMLARARQYRPELTAILMNQQTFEQHARGSAVAEPMGAVEEPREGLSTEEQKLYRDLAGLEHGRLEQEYLPAERVAAALEMSWM